ncbi:MAG: cold-shock protein [Robiginitomaculum sp.]
MATGVVKFFNQAKGFGFITPDDGTPDVFVHISSVEASGCPALTDGAKVTFDTEADKRGKGPKAVNLGLVD